MAGGGLGGGELVGLRVAGDDVGEDGGRVRFPDALESVGGFA